MSINPYESPKVPPERRAWLGKVVAIALQIVCVPLAGFVWFKTMDTAETYLTSLFPRLAVEGVRFGAFLIGFAAFVLTLGGCLTLAGIVGSSTTKQTAARTK